MVYSVFSSVSTPLGVIFKERKRVSILFKQQLMQKKGLSLFGLYSKNYSSSGKEVLYMVKRIAKDLSEEVYQGTSIHIFLEKELKK